MSETYEVKANDTLGSIAAAHGLPGWATLYGANRDTIRKEQDRRGCGREMQGPNWIFPGTELVIPRR